MEVWKVIKTTLTGKKKKKGETEGAERLENVTWRCCKAGQLPKGKRLSVKW